MKGWADVQGRDEHGRHGGGVRPDPGLVHDNPFARTTPWVFNSAALGAGTSFRWSSHISLCPIFLIPLCRKISRLP